MDINFKFSNLIGSVYRNGEVIFSPDGTSVISPVGNKISIFDLKNNVSRTLSIECEHNIVAMTINNSGTHLMVANEGGHVLYINLNTETVVFKFRANRIVRALRFSPSGDRIAICRDMDLQIHEIATQKFNMYYPFYLKKTYKLSSDTLNSVDWSEDGCLVVAGGDDSVVRVVGSRDYKNLFIHPLGGHQGSIINCQFLRNSYDIISVCKRGIANVWTSSLMKDDLLEGQWQKPDESMETEDTVIRLYYEKTKRYSLLESSGSGKSGIDVTSSCFHPKSNILVTAFSNGVFVLHEVPSFALIHNLRVSDFKISTVSINESGDWLALGCGKGSAAQLVVWEWQSETYVMKQQAHSQRILSAQFSPDGANLATGGEDGKVKIWNSRTGFCIVTFDEHTSSVSAVCWTQNGKAILSSSLDGTVRARDMKRYRNFRTLVCPEPTQLGSIAVDKSGGIVVAAGKEIFQIFIWSMETGHLLDVLNGHQSNISAISLYGNTLASSSWDKTLKIWNIIDSSCETTELSHEALDVAFSPCGQLVAVLTQDSTITFYHTNEMAYIGSIVATFDLDPGRGETDTITRQNAAKHKSFTCMEFSPDGNFLLLGGESNNFCLYSVPDRMLMKKFKITQNRSLNGVVLDVNRRNFSEFGNMALIDDSDSDLEPDQKKQIKLPGTKHMDLGERSARPEVAIYAIAYCPTGRRFSICCTEGVSVYSLDRAGLFDPFQLDSQTSPAAVKRALSLCDFSTALMASLRLNDTHLISRTMMTTGLDQIPLVVRSLPIQYTERLLKWMADGEFVWNSNHVHFLMIWLRSLLNEHGLQLKGRTDVATLTGIQQILSHHSKLISNLTDQNKYGLRYILDARKITSKQSRSKCTDKEN